MGKNRVVTKDISNQQAVEKVIRALQTGSLTFAQAQAMGLGVLPMGDYKGYAANWDIDLAVKQPLILAEQLNTLGILHGLKEDRDLQTIAIAAGSAIGTVGIEQITVPAGEEHDIVQIVGPAVDATGDKEVLPSIVVQVT